MIAAIGAFDGFHRGHCKLFSRAREMAERKKDSWGVVTFSPHPQSFLTEEPFPMLFTEREKDFLVRKLEIPELIRLPFTRGLAELSPEEFVECLERKYFLQGVVVGRDFRFGRSRSGDAGVLSRLGERKGWDVSVVDPVLVGDEKVSSSAVRRMVTAGDVAAAGEMLGYPFFVTGNVVHGDGRGQKLGYPTANLHVPSEKVVPDRGVYSGAAVCEAGLFPSAVNVGYNPTFEGNRPLRVEAHILGYEKDLYGKHIALFFFSRIRNEMRFAGSEKLLARIAADLSETRKIWARQGERLRVWLSKDRQGISYTGSCEH
ncbi:MAG: riboflavin biosynthesis protein RibF [Thermovirgaceae bacterium]